MENNTNIDKTLLFIHDRMLRMQEMINRFEFALKNPIRNKEGVERELELSIDIFQEEFAFLDEMLNLVPSLTNKIEITS